MGRSRERRTEEPASGSSEARWAGHEKLRILVGPYILEEHCAYMAHAFDDFDILTFGLYEGADIRLEGLYTLETLLDALPEGWAPDLMLLWRPEYTTMPVGIEGADFPVAMLISDWYVAFTPCMEVARFVNAVVTGSRGHRVYRAAGFDHILNMPMLGYQRGFDGAYVSGVRDIDVLCAGNPNWNVHRERERVVHTLLSLPPEVRFFHSPMVSREDYNRLLGRTKIFVNQTVIGEINMKCYEVPAAGACLFVEEDNLDIRNYLVPDESVVLFRRDNLNERILYYLRHEEERRAIAAAGHEAMHERSYRANMFDIVEKLRQIGRDRLLSMGREILRAEPRIRAAHYLGYAARFTGFGLDDALALAHQLPDEIGSGKALLQGTLQFTARSAPYDTRTGHPWRGMWSLQEILDYLRSAWQSCEDDLCLNLAWAQIVSGVGSAEEISAAFDRLLRQLESGCRIPLGGTHLYTLPQAQRFPFERRAWEQVERGVPPDGVLREMLLEFAYDLLARHQAKQGNRREAVQSLREAVAANPTSQLTRPKLVEELIAVGEYEEALSVGRAHLEQAPLDVAIRVRLLESEVRRGDVESARQLLREARRIAEVFCEKELQARLSTIDRKLSEAGMAAAQAQPA